MRTVRKPVPQLSTCKDCGEDFSYMRTLRPKLYCTRCDDAKRLERTRAWQARNNLKIGVDIPVEADTV